MPETTTHPTCERCDQLQDDCDCCERCEQVRDDCDCCERCESVRDDCTCCYECDSTEDDCTCYTCEGCEERCRENNGCNECHVCERCLDRGRIYHNHCEGCNTALSENDWYCGECGQCEDCVTSSDCEDCSSCADCCTCERSHPAIRNYTCDDYPDAIPSSPPCRPFLYLGVECEIEMLDGKSRADAAENIHSEHSDEILLKSDGSLNNGFEMVTGKYSLEAHKNLWPRLCETAIDNGCRSWKHSSTGLHVHMSRNFFSTLEIGKLVVFLNSEHTRGKITKLAGRSGNSYATFNAGKKFTDTRGTDRYEVVNLTNARTIEIRIFKGTLKASRILACVEFCHAVARWIQSASLTECEDWSSLWAYVKKHVSDYCHLIAFFEPEHANALATCERQSKGVCAVVASEQ